MATTILIVDDDESIHDIAEIFLEADGRTFRKAATLEAGFEIATSDSLDVLLLDNNLPDGFGAHSIAQFRALQPCLQVIMMSAHPTLDSAIAAVKGGAFDYVQKPFDCATIQRKVELAIERAATERARQRTQSRLMASEDRNARVFEASPDGMLLLDASNGAIRDANPAAVEIYRRTKAELCELTLDDLLAQPMSAYVTVLRLRQMHRRADGETFPAMVSLCHVNSDGELLILLTVRDVSAIENAEAERRRLEKITATTSKMEAIGQLAGGLAHDFNNLLFIMLNSAEFVLDVLPKPEDDDDFVADALTDIITCGHKGAALTRQLLAYTRHGEVGRSPIVLDEVVDSVRRILSRALGEDIEFIVETNDAGTVFADPDQLTQVIMNLAVNARDAMPSGGELRVTTSQIVVPADDTPPTLAAGPYARLDVRDDGSGMPAEVIERIFEPFYTTKDVDKGTGLGLYTVYSIVTQCGGTITVDSTEGQGTHFAVYLPHCTAKQQTAPKMLAVPKPPESLTVLLAEDEDGIRRLVRRMLEQNGYDVIAARNGVEALECVGKSERPIDLVITDVVMPHMGGHALAEALTAQRPHTPIVFMSGYAHEMGLDHGVDMSFLPKPFGPDDLTVAISRAMVSARGAD